MTVTPQHYSEYKKSGVSWLGDVPAHWGVRRLKTVFSKIVGGSTPSSAEPSFWDGDVVWITPTDVSKTQRLRTSLRRITREGLKSCSSELVPPGSIIVTSRAPVGNVALAETELCTNQGCKALLSKDDSILPLYGLALMQVLKPEIQSLATGTTFTEISTSTLGDVPLPLPPLDEQAAIVQYLDYKYRRIQRYIGAKQKLIKLLEEQKRAITHDAVTRGIDGDVLLKPSGVEWIGDVPEHWRISRVKAEFQSLNRHRIPLSSTERGEMSLRTYDYYGASGIIDKVDNFLFEGELLLIAEDGANLVLRNLPLAIIARGRYWVNNHAHILKVRRGNIEYLAAMMETLNYQPWISGAAQPKLTQDRIMSIAITVPPPEEQARIAAFLQVATQPLEAAIDHARREITLLHEYRSRLIADLVTGKLDVREAAVSIPDEISPEDMILDDMESFAENGQEDDDSGPEVSLEEVEA